MEDPSSSSTQRSTQEPRSTFLADARAVLAEKYRQQNRMAELESALADCLHHLAGVHGVPSEEREPDCMLRAKRLLGWKLG